MCFARPAFVFFLVLGTIVPVQAATFSTPLLEVPAGYTLLCYVTNVDKKSIKVTTTLQSNSGAVLSASDNCASISNGVLETGKTCSIAIGGPANARCTAVTSSSKVRAHMVVRGANFEPIVTVPATTKWPPL